MTATIDTSSEGPLLNRRALLLTLAAAMVPVSCGGGTPARLTLNGSVMKLPDGKPVTLRGINEGTWGKMQKQDAGLIAAQGATVVRVLIRWWGLYGSNDVESRSDDNPGHFKPDHLAEFLQNVQWCIDAGLWVIPVIDSNCGQNGLQNNSMVAYCDASGSYPGGHNFWTDQTQRQLFKEAWIYLAGKLKGYPNIAFYELLPEPLQGRGASVTADVSAFYQELMAAIEDKTGDTWTPFLVGARDAYNIQLCDEAYIADPRWANRVVYTSNLFIRTGGTQAHNIADLQTRLGALAAMKALRNVPVFIQQFGVRTGDDPNEYAIVVQDATTGADVVKSDVLAVYSTYWRAQI